MTLVLALVTVVAVAGIAATPRVPTAHAQEWQVERVVMLMRHGVRPPTKDPPVPVAVAPDPWPTWSVGPGELTPHGAAAIAQLASWDRQQFAALGVLPASGCPPPDSVTVTSDSMQRTIATGDAYVSALAPGCGLDNQHQPQTTEGDRLFDDSPDGDLSPAAARAAIDAALGTGGLAGATERLQPELDILTRTLCAGLDRECGLTGIPSGIVIDPTGRRRPHLSGGLAYGSTISEAFTLEYAEGKPMAEVGWGRIGPEEIQNAAAVHELELAVMDRPAALAVGNSGALARTIGDALVSGPRLTVLVGHDTNIANIAGLLDVHWAVAGFGDSEPGPGGSLMFEVLRDGNGNRYVRSAYRSQTLEQIRYLSDSVPVRVPLQPAGCRDDLYPDDPYPDKPYPDKPYPDSLCPISTFAALLNRSVAG